LAQNTAAAAVVASPTTAEEINAVVKPLVESAEGALESAGSKLLGLAGDALGVVGAVLLNPVQLNSGEDQIVAERNKANSSAAEPEPAPAAGGAGKGVKGGKKDRSQQGNVDQLEGLQHTQQQTNKSSKGTYGLRTGKSQQNIDNANKKIKSLEDVE
jgi:hypothetical protein